MGMVSVEVEVQIPLGHIKFNGNFKIRRKKRCYYKKKNE